MRNKYSIKKTISMKKFIVEFGKDFSEHMKNRLLELEIRCVLTRKNEKNRLDLKHVEHIKYNDDSIMKELSYGQFVVVDGNMFYSENCEQCDTVMESPIIQTIYNSLGSEAVVSDSLGNAKKIDDRNIDHIIDSILSVCPQVSDSYLNIMSKYL